MGREREGKKETLGGGWEIRYIRYIRYIRLLGWFPKLFFFTNVDNVLWVGAKRTKRMCLRALLKNNSLHVSLIGEGKKKKKKRGCLTSFIFKIQISPRGLNLTHALEYITFMRLPDHLTV